MKHHKISTAPLSFSDQLGITRTQKEHVIQKCNYIGKYAYSNVD